MVEKIKIKALLEAGLPENTPLARMYGWEAVDGIIFTLGDAGIVRSPGGDYVVATFIYHPVQVIWDVVNDLVSELSGTTYNYFKVQ